MSLLHNDNGNYTQAVVDSGEIWEGEISWDTWVEKYRPIPNPIASSPAVDDVLMYETYGEELELIKQTNPNNIWTMVDGDMSTIILAGWHFVNRIGYYITEVPWTDERETVLISVEVECECFDQDRYDEGEEAGDPECNQCEGYGLRTEYLD